MVPEGTERRHLFGGMSFDSRSMKRLLWILPCRSSAPGFPEMRCGAAPAGRRAIQQLPAGCHYRATPPTAPRSSKALPSAGATLSGRRCSSLRKLARVGRSRLPLTASKNGSIRWRHLFRDSGSGDSVDFTSIVLQSWT